MPILQSVKIFPPIGIARMGNSQESYLGPELPFPAPPPTPPGGKYKDNQCRIKRQAQLFHLWGYFDTGSPRELTVADGDITWTVHVANAKAVFRGEAAPGALIDPGPRTLHNANDSATFANGTYHHGGQVVEVPLGDASTDSKGRLIVRGGFGFSSSPDGIPLTSYFWDTAGWHDDVSDGPVNATIVVGGQPFKAAGAWVICPPPRYAPTTYAPITLYDTMRQAALDLNLSGAPQPAMPPSFVNDIWPILVRGLGMLRVAAADFPSGTHGPLSSVIPPPGQSGAPGMIFSSLTKPPSLVGSGGGDMPLLNPSGGGLGGNPADVAPTLRPFQYQQMQAWSQGNYVNDWPASGQPPAPTTITPEGLTQAALENCIGAPFYPGIEATVTTEVFSPSSPQTLPYSEPFRFDQTSMQPGDVTKGMARPWQADFAACTGSSGSQWWPSARPVSVYPQQGANSPIDWTNGLASSGLEMVDNWFRLGFIVDPGDGLPVQTEFLAVCKDCFIAADRNQIGQEEAQAAVNVSGGLITDAFYLIIEGYAPSDFGINTAPPLNPSAAQFQNWFGNPISLSPPAPAVLLQTTAVPTDLLLEDNTALTSAQRITIGYDIKFTGVNDFSFSGDAEAITINATVGSNAIGVSTSSATFDLTKTVAPYMDHGPISYLSDDVRVFKRQASDGQMLPQLSGPTLSNNDPLGFINALVNALRTAASDPNPATRQAAYDAFENLPQTEAGSALEWNTNLNNAPVFNFALCRIRYRATMTPAQNVRVFFRMFQTAATGTDYNSQTTYKSGGQPGTIIPLLGVQGGELVTIPFFAQTRQVGANVSLNTQQDTLNFLSMLNPDPSGNEVQAYFGVWLDMNQSQQFYPINPASAAGPFPESSGQTLMSIADLIRGTHQCLVTEISCTGFSIPDGATTASNAMLSQRNLAIDDSENPGATASRRAQHTFAIRPTAGNLAPKQGPDEMMIVWGNTPIGSEATIYLPGVRATEVLALARKNFNLQTLEKVDDHTLRCRTAGVTYLPIPQGSTVDLAGLITLDLPAGIRAGQVFRIVVRQVVDRPSAPPSPRATRQFIAAAETAAAASKARYIIGAFQFSVEVKKAGDILLADRRRLTMLNRVIATVPIENRWYPVLKRYLDQIAQRVTALGGDPGTIVGTSVPSQSQDSAKCRTLAALCATVVAAFVVILGTLTGTPRLIAGAIAAVLFVLAMAAWTAWCKPGPCGILKTLLLGTATGGGVLALLSLLGVVPAQPVIVLGVAVVVAVLAIVAALKKCW
jgi:hypothetical protein